MADQRTMQQFHLGNLYRPTLQGEWGNDPTLGALVPQLLWLEDVDADGVPGAPLLTLHDTLTGERIIVASQYHGRLRFAFDPERAVEALRREKYHSGLSAPLVTRLPFNYGRVPNWLKGLGESLLSRLSDSKMTPYPQPPVDFGTDFLIVLSQRRAGGADRVEWPDGKDFAIALSHDVDTAWLLERQSMLHRVAGIVRNHGFRSTWHLVDDYLGGSDVEDAIAWLSEQGHELASHSDNHDAKLAFLPIEARRKRWQQIAINANRLGMVGFRAAWLARTPAMFADLGDLGLFQYDSSVPNCHPWGVRQSYSGCASSVPYFWPGGIVEIPLLWFMEDIARDKDAWSIFKASLDKVAVAGGVFTLAMHPQPHHSANRRNLEAYERAVETLANQPRAWKARQQDISAWVIAQGREARHRF